MCTGPVHWHQGAGLHGADRCCRHGLLTVQLSPGLVLEAGLWPTSVRPAAAPADPAWSSLRGHEAWWLGTAPSTQRAWPVVLEVGPGRTSRLSQLRHPPAAPELCSFRVGKGLAISGPVCYVQLRFPRMRHQSLS